MISFFPCAYEDELFYSVLSRYADKSGYMTYGSVADELFYSRTVIPDIEFVNSLSDNALSQLTKNMDVNTIIMKHTMFSYYMRFMDLDKKKNAYNAIKQMQNDYRNYLVVPRKKGGTKRYLRYCPLCSENDRNLYGETYWHRNHQIPHIDICPIHFCNLINTSIEIRKNTSPSLVSAERIVPQHITPIQNHSEIEHRIAAYVNSIFQHDMDMDRSINIRSILTNKLLGTKYLSCSGNKRYISLLYSDFMSFYEELNPAQMIPKWQFEKVFTSYCKTTYEICLVLIFLNIGYKEALNSVLSKEIPKAKRKNNRGGVREKNWCQIDKEMLPKVKAAIHSITDDKVSRPKKITICTIEKMIGLANKRIEKMPLCKSEIEKHKESYKEYWAREVVWAAQKILSENAALNWKHIRELTNLSKDNFIKCFPYLKYHTSCDMANKIRSLV